MQQFCNFHIFKPNVRAVQNKLGPERLTRLGNLNVLRLPMIESELSTFTFTNMKMPAF